MRPIARAGENAAHTPATNNDDASALSVILSAVALPLQTRRVKLLSQTAVARKLEVTPGYVRTLDAELEPIRIDGGSRVYRPERVDEYAGYRSVLKGHRR